jgi:hypothetical protein
MFDDIKTWAIHWNEKDGSVFRQQSSVQKWNRSKILNFLKKIFPSCGLDPKHVQVELHGGSVPLVDFAESMRSILDNK